MGKTYKEQARLKFEARKTPKSWDGCRYDADTVLEDQESEAETELLHILVAMQNSRATINSLSYRMDRMSERLGKQVECVNEAEEDDCNKISQRKTNTDKTVTSLREKVEDLEARSHRSNM
ncbi:hypothetical protein NDU88_004236 [Pleurodeles waltl]|uniref:Tektin n=1 Tax=Pleurodeles waltl TaxID=8319 RepID=A0AAV7M6I4_PLEWA|nr:hypothetical protein NDU88_004236 [Pleurodeles waltl]